MNLQRPSIDSIEDITAEKAFHLMKASCNPRYGIGGIFEDFFGGRKSNFLGGCGDRRRTTHENIFAALYPRLKKQVIFGTRRGGYEKYLSKKFTADFYDEKRKIVYEIDGKNHGKGIQKHTDRIKDCFFWLEHKIRVVRYTNKQVEEMLFGWLIELEARGVIKDAVGYRKN